MQYQGPPDGICAITHAPLAEIELAVGFYSDAVHPYECEALVDWLRVRALNPMTNTAVVGWPGPGVLAALHDIPGRDPGPAAAALEKIIGELSVLFLIVMPSLEDDAEWGGVGADIERAHVRETQMRQARRQLPRMCSAPVYD